LRKNPEVCIGHAEVVSSGMISDGPQKTPFMEGPAKKLHFKTLKKHFQFKHGFLQIFNAELQRD
jgi:hypothetical protein